MENSTNANDPNTTPDATLAWYPATRRDNPEFEVLASVVPDHVQEYTANLLSVDADNCEIVMSPRYDSNTLHGMSRAAFHREFVCRGIPAPEHPLVPEQWHGLGYKPLTLDQLPMFATPAYFRGLHHGEPIERVGYVNRSVGVVQMSGEVVAVDSSSYPEDAVFAWRPVPPCDWEATQ